jgi:hypothetical protein
MRRRRERRIAFLIRILRRVVARPASDRIRVLSAGIPRPATARIVGGIAAADRTLVAGTYSWITTWKSLGAA